MSANPEMQVEVRVNGRCTTVAVYDTVDGYIFGHECVVYSEDPVWAEDVITQCKVKLAMMREAITRMTPLERWQNYDAACAAGKTSNEKPRP